MWCIFLHVHAFIVPGSSNDAGERTPESTTAKKTKHARLRQTRPQTQVSGELESQLREEIASRKKLAQVAERTIKQEEEAKTKLEMMKK